MNRNIAPFNLDLLVLTPEHLRVMNQIKVLDIYDGFSKTNFHPEGLFSTEIFGKAGEARRNQTFAYIKLNVEVFHPVIFKAICEMKELYLGIMKGTEYAVWNDEIKDLEASSAPEGGKTGFQFFLDHLPKIKFIKETEATRKSMKKASSSDFDFFDTINVKASIPTKRLFNARLIEKFKDKLMMKTMPVLPAGLRDHVIDSSGKPSEDEINNMYRSLIATANLIENVDVKSNLDQLNNARFNVQVKIREIYEYLESFVAGKGKLIQEGWAGRKIYHSTRNVITSHIPQSTELFGPKFVSTNQTSVGIYQLTRGALPWTQNKLKSGFLSQVFMGPNAPANLVDTKTLKKVVKSIDPNHYDEWMTDAGIEGVLSRFGQVDLRHEHLMLEDCFMGLIYKGPDMTWKFLQDIDEVPERLRVGKWKELISPITFAELIYLSIYEEANDIPNTSTRYPVANFGSIYPSFTYLKSTVRTETRIKLDDMWEKTESVAAEFPIRGLQFFDSQSPSPVHVSRLTADFDGDQMNFIPVLSDEARSEIKDLLNSADFYVGVDGKMTFSASTPVVNLVLRNMTR